MHWKSGIFFRSKNSDPVIIGFRDENQIRIRRIQDHSKESFQDQIFKVFRDQRKDQIGSHVKWSCDPQVLRDQVWISFWIRMRAQVEVRWAWISGPKNHGSFKEKRKDRSVGGMESNIQWIRSKTSYHDSDPGSAWSGKRVNYLFGDQILEFGSFHKEGIIWRYDFIFVHMIYINVHLHVYILRYALVWFFFPLFCASVVLSFYSFR